MSCENFKQARNNTKKLLEKARTATPPTTPTQSTTNGSLSKEIISPSTEKPDDGQDKMEVEKSLTHNTDQTSTTENSSLESNLNTLPSEQNQASSELPIEGKETTLTDRTTPIQDPTKESANTKEKKQEVINKRHNTRSQKPSSS